MEIFVILIYLKKKRTKFYNKSEKCRLYNFESNKIIISQDFFFFLWEGFWGLKEKKVPENAFVIEVQESIPAVQYEEASPQSLMTPSSSNSREEVSSLETPSRRMQRLREINESCNYSVMEPESFEEAEKQEV